MEVYDGKDLGLTYSAECSLFKVWAPTALAVSLVLYETDGNQLNTGSNINDKDSGRILYMQQQNGGVWETKLSGDLKGRYYMYRAVFADGNVTEAVDPYATAVSANGLRTAIIDLKDTNPEKWGRMFLHLSGIQLTLLFMNCMCVIFPLMKALAWFIRGHIRHLLNLD